MSYYHFPRENSFSERYQKVKIYLEKFRKIIREHFVIDMFWSQLEILMSIFLETFVVKTSYSLSHCVKSVQLRSFIWSVFSCIWTQCRDLWSKFGHFSRSVKFVNTFESLQLEDPNSIQIFDNKK